MNAKMHEVKTRKVAELIPYARNARTHTEEQVAQIAASIKEFGFTAPIVVDDEGVILAGHGRLLALFKLGIEDATCVEAKGLTNAQRKAYTLADNRIAMNSGWDDELLKIELGDLKSLGFDLDILGWGSGLPDFEGTIDYSILDEQTLDDEINGLVAGVKRAIQIEFDAEQYPEAIEIISYWRNQGANIGYMILKHLRSEKEKHEAL